MDYSDHSKVLNMLKASQDADHDMREQAREAHLFVDARDGQWEPQFWNQNSDKPRYTFDLTNPIIDQIAGEMEQADFDITIRPSGGEATKDVAQTLDGLVRNIENISNAKEVFNEAGRSMTTGGLDGWRIVQEHVNDDSFDQDLVIQKINNFVDRVWFDVNSEKRDKSDSRYAFVLQTISKEAFDEKWPDRAGLSITQDASAEAYSHKAEAVVVGEFYFIKEVDREIVLMSNNSVYEDNESFQKVKDELERAGVTELRRRKRKKNVVYIRKFDGEGWIDGEKETVFSYIPVVPTYANFKINEGKTIYWGAVEKIIDQQRVLNYSLSREIEEGALAPRQKYWMTEKQGEGYEDTLATLNTNTDPVQFYTNDSEVPGPPPQVGGAQINPGLRTISEAMRSMVGQSASMFAANMGDNPGLQSGVAIEKLQNKGDTGTIKYFKAQECAIRHTARILVDAIPKVYDAERQVRILNEDGSFDMVTLNQSVRDEQTGDVVVLNDLSVGTYDVTCSAGPAFQNRQQETVKALTEIAQVDPSVIQLGGDIMLNNITAPGMDKLAERKRMQLLSAGAIPQEQMTDEEMQAMQQAAANQQQQPDPAMVLAQAEQVRGQAELLNAQNKQQEMQVNAQLKAQQQQIEMAKLQQTGQKDSISASQKQQEFQLSIEKMQQDLILAMQEQQRRNDETAISMQKTQAETLNLLREAMGVDKVIGPNNVQAYAGQAEQIVENQQTIDRGIE